MTALQRMYLAARAGRRRRHNEALRHIAGETGIDEATIARCLRRARRTDEIEAKRTES